MCVCDVYLMLGLDLPTHSIVPNDNASKSIKEIGIKECGVVKRLVSFKAL